MSQCVAVSCSVPDGIYCVLFLYFVLSRGREVGSLRKNKFSLLFFLWLMAFFFALFPCFVMGWLRSVGSIKLYVAFAEYRLFYRSLLQKRPFCSAIHGLWVVSFFERSVVLSFIARRFQCNALQHSVIHCNTLQHTATHYSTLQHTATHCSTLQHTATHCNTLQHTVTHYNTLQHTATHCNTM